jgi:hypothetical protein
MQRYITIIILALFTAFFPHLGFPGYIKVTGTTLLSLGITLIAYMGYREAKNMKALPSVSLPHVSMLNFKCKKSPFSQDFVSTMGTVTDIPKPNYEEANEEDV